MSIIFTDIDGTLYGEEKKIHKDLIGNIKEAKNASFMFNISTGNGMFDYMKELAYKLKAKYLITSNGACIYDVPKKKIIFEDKIDKDIANKILFKANKMSISSNWWDEKIIFTNKYTSEELKKQCSNSAGYNFKNIKLSKEVYNDIYKIEFISKTEKEIKQLIKDINFYNLQISRISKLHIEVTKNNVSKGNAVLRICKIHNVDPKTVMTIGDSGNDLSMLQLTKYSYAMANANSEVKKVANLNAAAYNQNGLGLSIIDYIHRRKKY
ncbi:MAG: Cof-type HAD-IIB family hydrolase [Mycoplasma sp.]|nr:Cof-type HAD-IIB family hydrolase [Mycoplasma sp.]